MRIRRHSSPVLITVVALLMAWTADATARLEIDLGGTWQYQKSSQTNYPPPASWQTNTVPGYLSGWQYEHAWYRTTFALTSSVAGTHLTLRFGGVKFDSKVWLNGTYVGGQLNGYNPFELDVTAAALPGQTNELIVGVTDWTATFSRPVDFSGKASYQDPRDVVTNALLAPIGGRYDLYGIWQPVKLISTPAVSLSDVFVMPSVRQQQLTVRLTLRNDSGSAQSATVSNRVTDAGIPVLDLPARQVTVPAGGTTNFDVVTAWTNAHLWSNFDPHLYSLETIVTNGLGSADSLSTRFGFRELWCVTNQFYLNGTPIHLLAAATWPPNTPLPDAQIRQVLQDVKAGNNVSFRLHTQPWDERWYDLADETGVLIVEECAVWCDSYAYRLADPVFWTNYAQHVTGAVKRDCNHPSIVIWSLENEVLSCGGAQACSNTPAQLAGMARLLKGLDPTRLVTFESDLDPGGEANVLGLHYPHEYPDFAVWPNTTYWMNQPIPRDWVAGGQWTWDRTKPLYIGEFLWVPGTSAADFTILFGDDAYSDPATYRNRAKAQTWRMQTEAYRAYGVSGICPWTIFEDPAMTWGVFDLVTNKNVLYQSQKTAFHPNAVFGEEYNTRFFAGETIPRTVRVYNDTPAAGDFTLKWRAGSGSWQTRSVSLAPAGQSRESISFTAPSTNGPFTLQYELDEGTNMVFTNSIPCEAYARTALSIPPGCRLGVFDPHGAVTGLLARSAVPFTNITDLSTAAYTQLDVLLIGTAALTNEVVPEIGGGVAAQWQDFMFRGGWIVTLEQTNYPCWMPGQLELNDFDASYAFPNSSHPVTQGISADELRWWADDNRLVAKALSVPAIGNFRVLASIGSTRGLEYAGAVEVPVGLGGLIASQLLLAERFDVEPMSGLLCQRILNYCTQSAGRTVLEPAALLTETNSTAAAKLAEIGLVGVNCSGRLSECDPSRHPVLVVAGNDAIWQEATQNLPTLINYVEHGGKLLLHRPTSDFLAAAQSNLFPQLDAADTTPGVVLRRDSTNAAAQLTSHDLYWVEEAGQWNKAEVLSTNVAHRYYRKRFNATTYNTIQAENMPIHTSGGAGSGGWWLWSNGYVAQDIVVTQAGPYLVNVSASGTPVLGGWPQMSLKIDGSVQDSISVTSTQLAYYSMMTDLTPGTHQLAISFDNDAYAPPEDRNLFLDEIRWGPDLDTSTILLTKPGAVAQVSRGSGLVILDEILWEEETLNARKAGRYVSTLLTGLGAAMRQPFVLGVEAESMSNVNISVCSVHNGIVNVGSNGRIETPIRFDSTGSYTFDLTASGTIATNIWPLVAILIDGATQQVFSVTSTAMSHYVFPISVVAGQHTVALVFLNDYYAPPEDRNVAYDRLTIAPVTSNYETWRNTRFTTQELLTPGTSGDLADPDADGAGNWQEYLADTDPMSSNSTLRITGLRNATGGPRIDWKGGADAWQYLECRRELVGTTEQWRAIFTNPPPAAATANITDTNATTPRLFYRIKAERK